MGINPDGEVVEFYQGRERYVPCRVKVLQGGSVVWLNITTEELMDTVGCTNWKGANFGTLEHRRMMVKSVLKVYLNDLCGRIEIYRGCGDVIYDNEGFKTLEWLQKVREYWADKDSEIVDMANKAIAKYLAENL